MSLVDGASPQIAIASWPADRLEALIRHWRRCPDCEPLGSPLVSVTPGQGRRAFTWRRTAEETLTMDDLALSLKRQLGRAKLDHAEILAALTGLAMDTPAVFGALTTRLQGGITS